MTEYIALIPWRQVAGMTGICVIAAWLAGVVLMCQVDPPVLWRWRLAWPYLAWIALRSLYCKVTGTPEDLDG